ncbi:ABC transporter ATP-binding protein [Falsiroseomonas sp.]|uniref:ABC transporter ATP-binding protein n=1 Tax=Falsiroseomonas sp. TaxID=2870721 RepID=UPI0034A10F27
MTPLVEARGLSRQFRIAGAGLLRAVQGVDLAIAPGQTLALVGESGCGKSTLGRLLIGLLPPSAGTIGFDGAPLPAPGSTAWRASRAAMQLVAQDPLGSLNPRLPIGLQVAEGLVVHRRARSLRDAAPEALAMLTQVGLGADHAARFPHELSGGQRQRVAIARALVLRPRLLVLDEPVSALDVSVQAQVVALLATLQRALGTTQLFISHDLRVVRHIADRVAVMYCGRIVEQAAVAELYATPQHPYTRALLAALPTVDPAAPRQALALREGEPASAMAPPPGCAFHPRCPLAISACAKDPPPTLHEAAPGRRVACHLVPAYRKAETAPESLPA